MSYGGKRFSYRRRGEKKNSILGGRHCGGGERTPEDTMISRVLNYSPPPFFEPLNPKVYSLLNQNPVVCLSVRVKVKWWGLGVGGRSYWRGKLLAPLSKTKINNFVKPGETAQGSVGPYLGFLVHPGTPYLTHCQKTGYKKQH